VMSDVDGTPPGVDGVATGVSRERPMVRVVADRIEGELVRSLPPRFTSAYEALLLRCFPVLRGAAERDPDAAVSSTKSVRARVTTGQTETRGAAHNARRSGLSQRDPLGSEKAIRLRARVDRKLRALAREMSAFIEGTDQRRDQLRRCTRCRTFADTDWLYCPRDGAPTEQVD